MESRLTQADMVVFDKSTAFHENITESRFNR